MVEAGGLFYTDIKQGLHWTIKTQASWNMIFSPVDLNGTEELFLNRWKGIC